MQPAHVDGLVMPDQSPFKSKFLTPSPGRTQGWAPGSQCLTWQSKWNSNSNPGVTARGNKWILTSYVRLCKHFDKEFLHPHSFCIPQHPPSSSELITEPLVSGTKYHHAADGNWISLIGVDTTQLITMWQCWGNQKKTNKQKPVPKYLHS